MLRPHEPLQHDLPRSWHGSCSHGVATCCSYFIPSDHALCHSQVTTMMMRVAPVAGDPAKAARSRVQAGGAGALGGHRRRLHHRGHARAGADHQRLVHEHQGAGQELRLYCCGSKICVSFAEGMSDVMPHAQEYRHICAVLYFKSGHVTSALGRYAVPTSMLGCKKSHCCLSYPAGDNTRRHVAG